MDAQVFKYVVSAGALLLLVLHVFWPHLGIDLISIGLLLIAIFPWAERWLKKLAFSGLKDIEFPGGLKISFAEIKETSDKIIFAEGNVTVPASKSSGVATSLGSNVPAVKEFKEKLSINSTDYTQAIPTADPNLVLVAFRIEIEKRLRKIADVNGLKASNPSLNRLVRQLEDNAILPSVTASALLDLIKFGNQAAHGALVAPDVVELIHEVAPGIIEELDGKIKGSEAI